MQNLGDFFPEETRRQLADNNLKIGAVLRFHVPFTNPPKTKRQIVVGFDNDNILLATVLINTEINPNVFPNQILRDLHLKLETNNRNYIEHDSFVDCSKVRPQNKSEIIALLTLEPTAHLGELAPNDLAIVLEKIRNAHTISVHEKRRFGLI